MLAIFSKSVATIPMPDYLKLKTLDSIIEEQEIVSFFTTRHPESFAIDLSPSCVLCASPDVTHPIIPRGFAVKDDIFCFLLGKLENIASLEDILDVNEEENEALVLLDGFRTSRQEDTYWLTLLKALVGKYSVILFDNKCKRMFAASDNDTTSGLPFFWGTDFNGNLILTTDEVVVRRACGQSYGFFPKGCYIDSSMGPGVRNFNVPELLVDPECMLELFYDEMYQIEQVEGNTENNQGFGTNSSNDTNISETESTARS